MLFTEGKSIRDKFNNVTFIEEGHQYIVNGENKTSVSSIIRQWENHFDLESASKNKARSIGSKPSLVKNFWKNINKLSISKGSLTHNTLENVSKYIKEYNTFEGLGQIQQGIEFLKEAINNGYSIVDMEVPMYFEKGDFCGTGDLILEKEGFHLFDYKTNKDVYKNYGNYMKPPFDFLIDCPLSHYYIQLNLYSLMLEEQEIFINNMFVVWLKENTYEIIEIPNLKTILKEIYK